MRGYQNNPPGNPTSSALRESISVDGTSRSVGPATHYGLTSSQHHPLAAPTDDTVRLGLVLQQGDPVPSHDESQSSQSSQLFVDPHGSRQLPFYPEVIHPHHAPRGHLDRTDLEKDELIQSSSTLFPLMNIIFGFTDTFRKAPMRPSEIKTGLRFFLPGVHDRLADEWIDILETTPREYCICAPEDVLQAYKRRHGQLRISFKSILEEQSRNPELVVYPAIQPPFTGWSHTTIDSHLASSTTLPTQRAVRKRKKLNISEEEGTDSEEQLLSAPKRKKHNDQIKQLPKSAPKPSQPDAIDVWMAKFPNRASGRYGGRGNKNVAWSRGHIQAYVELLKIPFEEIPDDANSEFSHEMKSVATPKSVDPTILTVVTTAEELMAFLPYSTVNYEVCERLYRSWKPKEIADYMHHVRNLQYPGSYQRTMFSHQHRTENVPDTHRISNVPSNMSRKSALDRERKKPLHDYYLWWMGEGVVNYPTGKAAQLLTRVIHHVRNITGDRKIKLSQVQEYAKKHGIIVPAQDVIKSTTDSVEEDLPSVAFLTQIDNEFYVKFGKHSTAV